MTNLRQLFLQNLAQTSDSPLAVEVERAEGVYMIRKDGKKVIDLISGIGVSNVGHCHPKVVKAVQKQAEQYMHLMVYGEFVLSPQVQLANEIAKTLPEPLKNIYLVNSGAEATEGALKLAKRYTGRSEIISAYHSYHGSTHGPLSINGSEYFKRNYRPLLPDVRHIHYNRFEDLEFITSRTAAVIVETVQGEAGVVVPEPGYLPALKQRCEEVGALLILDEVQTGFGRTGTFWGFEQFDVVPDILLTAKGMGGGMPIGAFISSHEIMRVFQENPFLGHITTFGGHPVSSAASLACLKIVRKEKLYKQAKAKGELFKKYLKHPKIKEIRSLGLMMAVEFESFEVLKPIIDEAVKKGVLTDWFLYNDKSMRIAPPLIISEKQIKKACEKLLKAIDKKPKK
ncbi:aspartate aminotransferase family protein [Rapidithrix thailandica]